MAVCNAFKRALGISGRCTGDYETDGGPQRTMWTHLGPYTLTRLLQAAKGHDELIEFDGGTGLRPRTPSIAVKIRISLSVTLTSSGYERTRSHHQSPGQTQF
jgi:hypothetical protein